MASTATAMAVSKSVAQDVQNLNTRWRANLAVALAVAPIRTQPYLDTVVALVVAAILGQRSSVSLLPKMVKQRGFSIHNCFYMLTDLMLHCSLVRAQNKTHPTWTQPRTTRQDGCNHNKRSTHLRQKYIAQNAHTQYLRSNEKCSSLFSPLTPQKSQYTCKRPWISVWSQNHTLDWVWEEGLQCHTKCMHFKDTKKMSTISFCSEGI